MRVPTMVRILVVSFLVNKVGATGPTPYQKEIISGHDFTYDVVTWHVEQEDYDHVDV